MPDRSWFRQMQDVAERIATEREAFLRRFVESTRLSVEEAARLFELCETQPRLEGNRIVVEFSMRFRPTYLRECAHDFRQQIQGRPAPEEPCSDD